MTREAGQEASIVQRKAWCSAGRDGGTGFCKLVAKPLAGKWSILEIIEHLIDRKGFRRAVFEHPIAGPLSVEQALHMDQVHLDTHVRQIRRLQRLLI
jgi:hypothetical protein